MPRYITKQDIIDRYGEDVFVTAADLDCDNVADVDPVDTAIADAEDMIDSFLGNRYALPLPGVIDLLDPSNNTFPTVLKRKAVDIAVYLLLSEHPSLTEERTARFEGAKKWLMMVANRELSLGVPDHPPSRTGGVVRTGPDREFTREKTKGIV